MYEDYVTVSARSGRLADKTARMEMDEEGQVLKRDTWLELAASLEQDGFEKHLISRQIIKIVERKMRADIEDPEIRKNVHFNNTYFFKVMTANGYTGSSQDSKVLTDISAAEYPDEPEFHTLRELLELSEANVFLIRRLIAKCTINPDLIRKAKGTDIEYQERLVRANELVTDRRNIVRREIKKNIIARDVHAIRRDQDTAKTMYDDRESLTMFRKCMAMVAVAIGYDMNHVARMLQITSKHIKQNIYADAPKNELLLQLKWFDRCPNCGLYLSDVTQKLIDGFGDGQTIKYAPDEIEPLKVNTYQAENIRLKKQIERLKK